MKLKELLLPIALLVLVGSAGEAEALTVEERQKTDQMAAVTCAHPHAAGIQRGSLDMAVASVKMHARTAEPSKTLREAS